LLGQGEAAPGWGTHQTVDVDGVRVFVKRIPVTELEHAHAFSTRNMFEMPLYYNYGVGSAGFGAFRELLTHVKTTNWALGGGCASFPLLYGYRLMAHEGERAVLDAERRDGYVRYWGGSESIGRYFDARMRAPHDVVLFLEHVPHTLHEWLMEHADDAVAMLERLRDAISFLRSQGVVHFDAHYSNVLTDGAQVYVSDFGLALDGGFDLSDDERRFHAAHEYYDYGEIVWSLGYVLAFMFQKLSEEDRKPVAGVCGITSGTAPDEVIGALVRNVERVEDEMGLPRAFVELVVRHREVMLLIDDFFVAMRRNNAKDTRLDLVRLRGLLGETGFVG
jgi:hypothetical protein